MARQQAAMLACVLAALLLVSHAQCASFTESFDSSFTERWTHSSAEKYNGKFAAEAPKGLSDVALKVTEKARHYGIATALPEVTDPAQGLVLQYDLKLADGLTCGGAYMKFLTADADVKFEELKDDSAYTVMFGPDKCGATNKVHLILRHKSPKTGEIEEKHLKYPPSVLLDDKTHVYTAVLHPNNTYDVLIDGESKKSGSLFDDFEPAINPPEEIDDPEDRKPETWVDIAKIPDPEAAKPEDWDEDAPREIPDEEAEKPGGWLDDEPDEIDDPDAKQPEDWDEEEDGVWEPPRISNPACKDAPGCGEWKRPTKSNPAYKGKWVPPMIDNPEYKGIWKPARIANPAYFKDDTPLANLGKISAAAIEIWTMDNNYYFDDVVVANDPAVAEAFRLKTWTPKHEVEEAAAAKKEAEEEAARKKEEEAAKSADSGGIFEKASDALSAVVDRLPFLAPAQPVAQAAIDFVAERPYVLYAAAVLPVLALLVSAAGALFGGKKVADSLAQAKKEDTVTADDAAAAVAEEVEEEEEEEADAAAAAGARKRTTRARRE
jgi:calnexin